jgi:hypothetical protein
MHIAFRLALSLDVSHDLCAASNCHLKPKSRLRPGNFKLLDLWIQPFRTEQEQGLLHPVRGRLFLQDPNLTFSSPVLVEW